MTSLGTFVLAQAQSAEDESGNFLVTPEHRADDLDAARVRDRHARAAQVRVPAITEALDKRQRAIEESIDTAERTRADAEQILQEYRERLREARAQADEIVARARKAAEVHEREALEKAKIQREELLEQTRRDIEAETRRAIQEIRNEVADLTVLATEKVTRKTPRRGRPAASGRGGAARARLLVA